MEKEQNNKQSAELAKLLNEGLRYHREGQLHKAEDIYNRILEINSRYPDALHLSGVIAHQLGDERKAVRFIQNAVAINPGKSAYYSNMGLALHNLGRFDEALTAYRKALELKPDFAEACYNMGNVFKDSGRSGEAIVCYEKALALKADYAEPYGTMLHLLQHNCDWEKLEKQLPVFNAMTENALASGRTPAETPFECLTRSADPARNYAVSKAWSMGIARQMAVFQLSFPFPEERFRNRSKIIIGYLSNDFHNHATAHLMRTLFGLHNRDEFEIYCYSYGGDDGSDYRKKIEQDSDKFTDISSLGHIEAAKQIYADKVDILLDLKGHTKNNRIGICALRPAPVQITYLGFPGTSGADFLDYMITDRIVSPPEHRAHFSESFIYMPDCYQVNDNRQSVSGKKYRRADFGLPEKGFVFCSFNQNFKIEPLMFGVWTEILQEVPDSVLWLVWENESAEKNLKREAEKRGISPDRLVFSKRIEKKEHLARHRLADLALDTRIVNGHTTSSDALWAGVPVIAVKGSHFASRVSESILRAVGLSELITENLKEYKSLAIRLALDPGRLKVVKEKLWQNRRTESLFDTPRFVANLEEAYRQVYKNFREGRRPDIIEIRENTVNSNIVPEKPDENRKFNISGEIQKALRLHEVGRIEEADEIYQEILRRIPDHPDALHLSGVAAHQQGEHDKAVAMIEKAIERVPGNPVFYSNLGAAVQGQGDWDRAAACYHKVLDISPENAEAYYNLGNVSKNKGDTDEALSYYQKAIHIKPGYAEAYHNLGNAIQHEKPEEALVHYRKAVELKPDYPQAYNNMGNLFQGRKNLPEAVSCYQKALELKPDYAEAYNNLANIYKDQGRFAQAVAAYRKALELKPELVETLNNLGITLNEQDKKEEALACYRKAAKLRPDYAETFNNMGNLFQSVKKTDEAVRYYKKALAIDPEHSRAYSSLIFQLQHACAWDEIQNLMPGLDRLTRKALEDGRETEEMPFMSMMMRPDPAHNYAVAKSWSDAVSRRMEGQRGNFSFDKNSRARKDKITIAYLSNDFHNHATAHLMRTFFGLHNRKRFEIYAYSYGKDDGSHYRKQIEKDCDRFVDIYAMNHAEAAQCIFRDQVDILIELKGYTKGNRLEICALRPAPVQVSYLGYPGTTGADFIDYIITDRVVSPVSHAPFFSEKFVYMPNTYQVNDHVQPISAKAMKRADFGLPDSSFVLCSFNQLYKTEPLMFDIWMRILRKIPGSVLWLFRGSASAQQNILKEAGARGVNPERIIFAQSMPKDEHLARHRLADLALDTRIVNGHTTTSDALWAGLPVVTLEGTHFASRVSASLLSAVGLPELITRSSAEYEKLVLRLWENPAELENIKKKLLENCKSYPLFDTGRFVRNLEDAYAQMWHIYLAGEKPRQMEIRETGVRSQDSGVRGQEPGGRSQESGVRSQESGVRGQDSPAPGTRPPEPGPRPPAPGTRPPEPGPRPPAPLFQEELTKAVGLHRSGQIQAADLMYQRILEQNPAHPDALHLSGLVAHASGDNEKAENLIRRAIAQQPANPVFFSNLGAVLKGLNRVDDAIAAYQKAVALNPNHPEAYYNMGLAYVRKKEIEAALDCYQKALDVKPDYEEAYCNLVFQSHHACDWQRIRELSGGIDRFTKNALAQGRKPVETPFMNILRHADPAYNFEVAASWAAHVQKHMRNTVPLRFPFERYRNFPEKKIRIGYLSNGFHNHPTAHLMLGLFAMHRRDLFEVYCYAYGKEDGTHYKDSILQSCDKFTELRGMSHPAAAQRIYDDNIHILVDLIGYTGDNNTLLRVPSLCPAPVQVSYLAYPGTTGAAYFDYVITDKIVSPPHHAPWFSEKFVYMPSCYQVNDDKQPISSKVMHRSDFGLPETAFVFCSFNNNYKLEPVMFDVWMNILRRVPGSVLWLLQKNSLVQKNLKKEAAARGIDPERLVFADIMIKDEHLARHRLADLALDTRIINGHTTTSDALWAGLPLITLEGSHFASRVSSSLLHAVGLPELITYDIKDYEEMAVRFAQNPRELAEIKEKLAENRLREPLFNTRRFVAALEAAYRKMWEIFLKGEKPVQMQISESGQIPAAPQEPRPVPKSPLPVPELQKELEKAVLYHRQGELEKAHAVYQKVLSVHPEHPDALHLSGVIAHQRDRADLAADLIEKAIRHFPGNPLYYSNLAASFQKLGKGEKAAEAFRKALELKPDYLEARYNLGNILRGLGRAKEAAECYEKVLEQKPDYAEVCNNLGVVFQDMGENGKALAYYQKALELQADYAEVYNNMGNTFRAMGEPEKAVLHYKKSLALKPEYAEVRNNMGVVYQEMKEPEKALACYRKSLELKPDYAEVYNNMGLILRQQRKFDEALAAYHKAISLKPDYPEVYNNLGNVCRAQRKYEEALEYFQKSLELRPDYTDAYNNMGNTYQDMGKSEDAVSSYQKSLEINPHQIQSYMSMGLVHQEKRELEAAIECYENILRIDPDSSDAYAGLFHQSQHVCDWKRLASMKNRMDALTETALKAGKKPAETPFMNISRQESAENNFRVAGIWAKEMEKNAAGLRQNFSFENRGKAKSKLIIGYLSNDFRNHPVAHLMRSLFGLHNREEFEIFCYSYGKEDKSSYRKKIKADCDRFIDIRYMPHDAAAKKIYEDRVDILVELMGYTTDSRLEICALRPAPIQVSYLGYPGTTGAKYMDYIITDRIVTPESKIPFYSEQPVWLPHCYQVNDHRQAIAGIEYTRADFGLPADVFIFCSFNQAYKIEPVIFDVWMNILRRVPQSILWLLEGGEAVRKNLLNEAVSRGIDAKRLIFSQRLPKQKHLARQKLADLILDTRIYNGHTTSSDALWAGVPLITLRGAHFPARVSASILTAVGLPELITDSLKEYGDLAVRLAENPDELEAVRQKLSENRLKYPLFDTPRFVRNMENAYKEMWDIFAKGEVPRSIRVKEIF